MHAATGPQVCCAGFPGAVLCAPCMLLRLAGSLHAHYGCGHPHLAALCSPLLSLLLQVYTKLNNMQACTQMLKTFKERYTGNIMRVSEAQLPSIVSLGAHVNLLCQNPWVHMLTVPRAKAHKCRTPSANKLAPASPAPAAAASTPIAFVAAQHMPASARVSAYFYLGRTEVSSGHIEQGLQLLEQAFKECPRDSKNMQTILRFLVPVRVGAPLSRAAWSRVAYGRRLGPQAGGADALAACWLTGSQFVRLRHLVRLLLGCKQGLPLLFCSAAGRDSHPVSCRPRRVCVAGCSSRCCRACCRRSTCCSSMG